MTEQQNDMHDRVVLKQPQNTDPFSQISLQVLFSLQMTDLLKVFLN